MLFAGTADAQEKHYRFAYDQPRNTGYSIAGDLFSDKLKELSKGAMIIDQYPGAQLGQEPQVLQLVKAGDIDFAIISSANTATISPQAGVMSLHFLFRDDDHVVKGLADPRVFEAIRNMIDETTQGLHVIGTGSQGVRHMYSKKEIKNVGDIKGMKIRVQATATEDTMFPAYGAQTVHMPFGSVYTSLQTGVVDDRREQHQRLSRQQALRSGTGAEPHRSTKPTMRWCSSPTRPGRASPTSRRSGCWRLRTRSARRSRPRRSSWRRSAATKLKSMGVKIVDNVDKKSFTAIADPYLDKLAKDLGPHAVKIKDLIRSIN